MSQIFEVSYLFWIIPFFVGLGAVSIFGDLSIPVGMGLIFVFKPILNFFQANYSEQVFLMVSMLVGGIQIGMIVGGIILWAKERFW